MTAFSDNETPSLLFSEQGSAPTTPATGFWRLYTKAGGLFLVDDAGTELGPFVATLSDITLDEYADTFNDIGSSTGTVTPDPANGMWQAVTLTGNITLDLTNLTAGQTLTLDLTQDGTGSHTVSFTQTVEWPGGTAFTHTGTAGSRDRVEIDYDGTTYSGDVRGQDYS